MNEAKFSFGLILATPAALAAVQQAGQTPGEFLLRHENGDWGDLCDEDRHANDCSLKDGSRILSAYRTVTGTKIWVITEAADDQGNRAATTILLPEEY